MFDRLVSRVFALLVAAAVVLSGCQRAPASATATHPSPSPAKVIPLAHTPTDRVQDGPVPTRTRQTSTGSPTPDPPKSTLEPTPTEKVTTPPSTPTVELLDGIAFGFTHQRPDGNRLVSGRGSLPDDRPLDVALDGVPRWLVAAPTDGGSLWAVTLEDGRVQAFRVSVEGVEPVPVTPDRLAPDMPPLLRIVEGVPSLVTAPPGAASRLTHPVILSSSGRMAFLESGGDLVLWEGSETARLALNALPDARLLVDEQERALALTDATTRYQHGVLGDSVEAASVSLIETQPTPRVALTVSLPAGSVVEGLTPIWADLTGDGVREIVVTVSDAEHGAQIVVYDETGARVASGPPIGRGYRWRHQLAVAPFGPDGELELVDVLTPHIGGIVEFYRLEGDALRIVAVVRGYTSHRIGSRNLDQALVGDLDGDGRMELLLPNQAMNALGGIRRTAGGGDVAWTVLVDARVSTNLAAISHTDGRLGVGVGREDGVLRLWMP